MWGHDLDWNQDRDNVLKPPSTTMILAWFVCPCVCYLQNKNQPKLSEYNGADSQEECIGLQPSCPTFWVGGKNDLLDNFETGHCVPSFSFLSVVESGINILIVCWLSLSVKEIRNFGRWSLPPPPVCTVVFVLLLFSQMGFFKRVRPPQEEQEREQLQPQENGEGTSEA